MYIRTSKSGPRTYVRLAETYRDNNGKVKQRHLANLGRIETFAKQGHELVNSINRLLGGDTESPKDAEFDAARALGDSWVLQGLWDSLDLTRVLGKALSSTRRRFEAVDALRVMVFNRLCDPDSKLGALRWLEEAAVPGIEPDAFSHQQLLRAMDALADNLDAVRDALASQIKPLLDQQLTVAFYDLTTIRVHGHSEEDGELRRYGCSKELEGGITRQYMLAVVQSDCGIPLDFAVFEGNQSEVKTLLPVLTQNFARYQIKRVIVVADRGLLSLDNIDQLETCELPGGSTPDYIMALPASRYKTLRESLTTISFASDAPSVTEHHFVDRRLVIAHDPETAKAVALKRREGIEALCQLGDKLAAKLDHQDQGMTSRGRKASDRGAHARFSAALQDSPYKRFIQTDFEAERFSFNVNEAKVAEAELFDGKLFVLTSLSKESFAPEQIVQRYKALMDIETGFRVLKHDIDIAPVYHRLPRRLQSHSALCFIALLLSRIMRNRLKAAGSIYSPASALRQLRRLQLHRIYIGKVRYEGVGNMQPEQRQLFKDLAVKPPSKIAM